MGAKRTQGRYADLADQAVVDGRLRGPYAAPRVYVVSNVRLLREALHATLACDPRIEVVGASGLDGAARAILAARPDVLLLDVVTPESLGLPRRMRSLAPNLRSVAFAVGEDEADVVACAEAGVSGYVARDGSADDIVAAVLRAVSGELVCPPRIAAVLFARLAALADRSVGVSVEPLTPREREIADLVARGLPNKTIARELSLAPATIKNHVHNILQKLSLQRRGEIHRRMAAPGVADGRNDHSISLERVFGQAVSAGPVGQRRRPDGPDPHPAIF